MRLLFLLLLALASGASAQPLDIARIDAPASVDSGDNVRIMLTVDVHNRSDSNKRYALTAVVDGAERDRWTSTSALVPGASERVPLAWTQAVSGSALRGDVVLLNTRGIELARESFEIAVARGETPEGPPVVTVVTPPIGPRPVQQTVEIAPLAQIDVGFGRGPFGTARTVDPGTCLLGNLIIDDNFLDDSAEPGAFTLDADVINRGSTPIRYTFPTSFQLLYLGADSADGSDLLRDVQSLPLDLASAPLAPGASRLERFTLRLSDETVTEIRDHPLGTRYALVGALRASGDTQARDNQLRVQFSVMGAGTIRFGRLLDLALSVESCSVEPLR